MQQSYAQSREISASDLPCKPTAANKPKETYTGYGYGISSDLSIARNKASMQAMQELSASIKTNLKSVSTLYINQTGGQHQQEFDGMINESVSEALENLRTTCQKQEKVSDKIKVYIALELTKGELFNKIEAKAEENQYSKLDFDKKKFEEIFVKETSGN